VSGLVSWKTVMLILFVCPPTRPGASNADILITCKFRTGNVSMLAGLSWRQPANQVKVTIPDLGCVVV